jgi:galactose mutarotase-like enzyme
MAEAVQFTIASETLRVTLTALGAEMVGLTTDGRELQWDGDPAVWSGRAPLLFPIVGALAGGRYRLGDDTYALPRHGFARRSLFDIVERDGRRAVFRLAASEATRAVYPFEFVLDVTYAVDGPALAITAVIENRGDGPMPASFGFHPALRWPLPYGKPRADHVIRFERDEPAPIRRLDGDGCLLPQAFPTPVEGRTLRLRDELFSDDAVIFDRPASRRVVYGAPGAPAIAVTFPAMPHLGIWSKGGGAGFVCIEPWQGYADPAGFTGTLFEKPGVVPIEPGKAHACGMRIELLPQFG